VYLAAKGVCRVYHDAGSLKVCAENHDEVGHWLGGGGAASVAALATR
jgi:hypothetical protein